MVDSSLNECRRDFEVWAANEYGWNDFRFYTVYNYNNEQVNVAFNIWKAAWELQDDRVKGTMA